MTVNTLARRRPTRNPDPDVCSGVGRRDTPTDIYWVPPEYSFSPESLQFLEQDPVCLSYTVPPLILAPTKLGGLWV